MRCNLTTCVCICACACASCACACACTYSDSMFAHAHAHAQHAHVHVHLCICACACTCTCLGASQPASGFTRFRPRCLASGAIRPPAGQPSVRRTESPRSRPIHSRSGVVIRPRPPQTRCFTHTSQTVKPYIYSPYSVGRGFVSPHSAPAFLLFLCPHVRSAAVPMAPCDILRLLRVHYKG